jgi:hypothetical protein
LRLEIFPAVEVYILYNSMHYSKTQLAQSQHIAKFLTFIPARLIPDTAGTAKMLGETMSDTPSDGVSILQAMQQTEKILANDTKRILAGRVLGLGSVVIADVVRTVAASIVGVLSRSL